jgi:hypothetical protein
MIGKVSINSVNMLNLVKEFPEFREPVKVLMNYALFYLLNWTRALFYVEEVLELVGGGLTIMTIFSLICSPILSLMYMM